MLDVHVGTEIIRVDCDRTTMVNELVRKGPVEFEKITDDRVVLFADGIRVLIEETDYDIPIAVINAVTRLGGYSA